MKRCKTKYLIIFIFWMGYHITSNAQVSVTDSLKNLLEQNPHDTVKVYLLYKISDQYYDATVHDTAMIYARQAYRLALDLDYDKGQTRSLTRIGNVLEATSDFPAALKTYLDALEISESIGDLVGIGATDNNIARVYTEQKTANDFDKAIVYYRKAKEIFEQLGDNTKLSTALMNIGDNFEKMERLDSAWYYQNQAYQMSLLSGDIQQIGITLVNLGYIDLKNKQLDSAFNKFRTGIYYLNEASDWESLPDAWNSLSECFEKVGAVDSAVFYAKKSLVMAESGFNKQAQLDAVDQLASLYGSKKVFDSAYRYSSLATEIRSEIYNNEKAGEIQRTYTRELIRQQELEDQRVATAKKREDNLQIISISGFIITFFIVLIILSQKKINPRAIEILGVLGLLLVFEFITIFIHPFIGDLTHHTPIYMLAILVLIASILGPLHHSLTKWLKRKLVRRTTPVSEVNASATIAEPAKVSMPENLSYESSHKKVQEHDEKNKDASTPPAKLIIKVPTAHQHTDGSHKKGNKKGKH
jgi:tetratricopeptide (TPR) repeat protein